MKKRTHQNIIFTLFVLAAALALALVQRAGQAGAKGLYAHLQYNTAPSGSFEEMEISLGTDDRYDLVSGPYTIHLEVKDGAIAFVESPCPDHLCEHYGWLDAKDDYAACMPAGAAVTIRARG